MRAREGAIGTDRRQSRHRGGWATHHHRSTRRLTHVRPRDSTQRRAARLACRGLADLGVVERRLVDGCVADEPVDRLLRAERVELVAELVHLREFEARAMKASEERVASERQRQRRRVAHSHRPPRRGRLTAQRTNARSRVLGRPPPSYCPSARRTPARSRLARVTQVGRPSTDANVTTAGGPAMERKIGVG